MASTAQPDRADQTLEVRVLGEFAVRRNGQDVALPPSRKTRALLAYLAVVGRPQRRERLCQMFLGLVPTIRADLCDGAFRR